jgi:putative membrane protein
VHLARWCGILYAMIGILLRIVITAVLLVAASAYIPGVDIASGYNALMAGLVLGVVNLIIRPILFVLTLPVTLITFGLFSLVLNALLLWWVSSFVDGFAIAGFVPALLTSLLLSVGNWLAQKVV